MRDDLMGGLLATAVAAPLLIVCCGGGGILLAGIVGTVSAVAVWMGGLGGIAVLIAAAGGALTWRSLRRHKTFGNTCVGPTALEVEKNG